MMVMIRAFSPADRKVLLAVNGVGSTVLKRLEEMGFNTMAQLAAADMPSIVEMGASITGSSCWKNSPQARAAVQGAIDAAKAV
jgi:predicted RecB family nuclease